MSRSLYATKPIWSVAIFCAFVRYRAFRANDVDGDFPAGYACSNNC
jgi:hypothetical protein